MKQIAGATNAADGVLREIWKRGRMPLREAARKFGCDPDMAQVCDRLIEIMKNAKRVSEQIPFTMVSGDGIYVWGSSPEQAAHMRRLKRLPDWRKVKLLPPPIRTFTPKDAARILKLRTRTPESQLSRWSVMGYLMAPHFNDPGNWRRLF